MKDKPPLRVGLIGVTGYALAYFEEINKLVAKGLARWGAVTVINPQAAPQQMAFFRSEGVPVYADYRQMLEDQREALDWICIPTAINWHTQMAVKVLEMGLPVLLEKPLAATLQEVDIIQEAEQAAGLPVAIGFQHHYSDSTWQIKDQLLGGMIGEIQQIDSICLWPRPQSYYSRNNWGGRLFVGDSWVLDSPFHNAISHVVNLILFFAGSTRTGRADPLEVEAEIYRAKPIQNYDTVRTKALLDTGIRAGVVLSHSSAKNRDPEIRITGSRGTFLWRFSGQHLLQTRDQRIVFEDEDQIQVRENMFESVVRRIQGDPDAVICTTEQARGEVKWSNGIQDSTVLQDIPESSRRQILSPDGEVYDVVPGMESVASEAYRRFSWFSEAGAGWAASPMGMDLRRYTAFQARHVATQVLNEPIPAT